MDYYYAFAVLWELLGRIGRPPRPELAQATTVCLNKDSNEFSTHIDT